jgi:menaquinone-dependent protoporphyrinogen oxidase
MEGSMRVLVTAASRHGGTTSIGNEVARLLREVHTTDVEQHTGAREHRVFGGRIDDCTLSRGERARVRRHRVAQGDYRDWEEIRCWAAGIADQLHLLTDSSSEGPPP